MIGRLGLGCSLGLLSLGCGEAPILSSADAEALATSTEPGPTRYQISADGRVLGLAEVGADGLPKFTVADGLPSPCFADALAASWKDFEWPESVYVDASYYDPEEGTHNKTARGFDRSDADYPLAIIEEFLGSVYRVDPALPIDRRGTREGGPAFPATFEVTADRPRGASPENFTGLPLGRFTIESDGTVSLVTACEGPYLAGRLEKHFAQEELVLSFSQPGSRWRFLTERTPGDLRLSSGDDPDVRVRYRRGEPEYFASLMTVVDRAFNVSLDVEPVPSLAVSYP